MAEGTGLFVLVDIQYAEVEQRAEAGKPVTFVWYMAIGLTFYLTWVLEALIGGLFGNLITNPYAFGIDFCCRSIFSAW